MKVQLKGRVSDVRENDKGVYVTMNDTEEGGQVKVTFDKGTSVKPDALLNLDVVIKPGIGQYGLYLKAIKINKEGDK